MASVLVPVVYIIVVFGSLLVFSYFYRRHSAAQVFEPYFPSHPERNTYVTLLQMTDPPASDALLKAALVRRAVADVQRVLRLREDKPALQNLLQKGSIGDDLWNSLLAAEKELEAEVIEVVAEANSFVEGWGQVIFPTANEIIANEKMRHMFEALTGAKSEKDAQNETKAKGAPSPLTLSSTPASPQLSTSKSPSLIPPPSTGAESVVSSDGETPGSASTAASPRSSKSKKGKKRK